MKKEYKKPFLAVESFQLDAAIAGTCSNVGKFPLNHGIDSCTLADGDNDIGDVFFGRACADDIVNNNVNTNDDEFCYQALNITLGGLYVTS